MEVLEPLQAKAVPAVQKMSPAQAGLLLVPPNVQGRLRQLSPPFQLAFLGTETLFLVLCLGAATPFFRIRMY